MLIWLISNLHIRQGLDTSVVQVIALHIEIKFGYSNLKVRAGHIPLPDGPGQVKLPVGRVDLSKVSFYTLYKQIEKIEQFWSQASEFFLDVEPRKCSDISEDLQQCFEKYFIDQALTTLYRPNYPGQ